MSAGPVGVRWWRRFLPVEKLVDRRIHGFVERLGGVADELHVRLRQEQFHEVRDGVLVLELDDVLGLPGGDDVYLSQSISFRQVSALEAAR